MSLTSSPGRRIVGIVAALALLLFAASTVADGSAAANRSNAAPTLRLIRLNPVTVAGRHFRPHRRVHVKLISGQTLSRDAVPDGHGAFTLAFTGGVFDRCSSFSVVATQRPGATVVLRGPKPECPVAPTP